MGLDEKKRLEGLEEEELEEEEDLEEKDLNKLVDEACLSFCPCQSPADPPSPPVCATHHFIWAFTSFKNRGNFRNAPQNNLILPPVKLISYLRHT